MIHLLITWSVFSLQKSMKVHLQFVTAMNITKLYISVLDKWFSIELFLFLLLLKMKL